MKDEMNRNFSEDADASISGLIAGLPRVSAPADFDLRLRGRIARRRSAPSVGFRLPAALAYALGLGVVLIAFGLFGMVWIYSGRVGEVPDVATKTTTAPPAAPATTSLPAVPERASSDPIVSSQVPQPTNLQAAVRTPILTPQPRLAANAVRALPTPAPSLEPVTDAALKTARAVYPQGIHPGAPANTPNVTTPVAKPLDAKEVLAILGVNATLTGGKMLIGSVNTGSAGENAGLKAGDVVQTIDDKVVGAEASFPGGYLAKIVTVFREGKSVKIAVGK